MKLAVAIATFVPVASLAIPVTSSPSKQIWNRAEQQEIFSLRHAWLKLKDKKVLCITYDVIKENARKHYFGIGKAGKGTAFASFGWAGAGAGAGVPSSVEMSGRKKHIWM